jgi:hypothetical protein
MAKITRRDFASAYAEFASYESMLPGNPNTIFLKGLSLEGMQQYRDAAIEYSRYLRIETQSNQAKHAYQRLVQWGYVKPKKQ